MNSAVSTVSLLVVTHNCAPCLDPFFTTWAATVAASPTLTAQRPPIIVVDSGSTDDTPILAAARAAAVPAAGSATLLTLENIGYGSAANAGLAETTTDWILLCNPDLTFPLDFAQRFLTPILTGTAGLPPNTAVVVPRLLNADGAAQPSVGRWPTITALLTDQLYPRPQRKYVWHPPAAAAPIAWASGACLLLQRQAFASVGGFDPHFFMYVEDVDLQYRLTRAGHVIYYLPGAPVTHHASNASRPPRADAQRWAACGLLRFFALHSPHFRLPLYRLLALLSCRLPPAEALARRSAILNRSTGPGATIGP